MDDPKVTAGFRSAKAALPSIQIHLAKGHRHALPRIARANEAWVSDERTIQIELETEQGQIVVVPLDGYAMKNLHELFDQHLRLKKTLAEK